MRRRGVRVLTIDWREFGPPVEIWKNIEEMSKSHDTWYEELSFSLNKEPRMPIVPLDEPKGGKSPGKSKKKNRMAKAK